VIQDLLYTNEKAHVLKNIIAFVVLTKFVGGVLQQVYNRGLIGYAKEWQVYLLTRFFKFAKNLPFVRDIVQKEMGKVLSDMEKDVAGHKEGDIRYLQLPKKGFTKDEVQKNLDRFEAMTKVKFEDGRISGCVYHGGKELMEIIIDAYRRFAFSNPLHPDVFPGVRQMEAEVVAMVIKMFNGGKDACGTTTSGGTESILMACKAMRDWAREVKGITEPEMVVPVSAHAAFDKAAHYFGITILHAPVDEKSRKVDVKAVRRMITSNTILIVGSAPSFPHGVIDDIVALGKLAVRNKIGLHVDSCLGGFLVPFMEKAGYPLPLFDFRVPGVTSISCDTHKYGFAPKGSSVVLYSSRELRHYQYFVAPNWPGGVYASPTIAGSRSGALIAGCWAAMMTLGEEGYIESAKNIVGTTRKITKELSKIPGIKIFGEPLTSVVAFGSDQFDAYQLGGQLTKKGWNLNSLQYPASIHICCTTLTTKVADDLIRDVAAITAELMANPNKKSEGKAAIYGLAAAIPDRSVIDHIARGFIDCLFIA